MVQTKTQRRTVSKHAANENVKSERPRRRKNQGLRRGEPKLERTTFRTSREMDFFSEKELVTQTGHSVSEWPFVFLKETIDNALDACEESDIAPHITVTADAGGITVSDDGPGIPESTLRSAMDFTVRASNREAYVAPDRGAQGNALKTLLPMPRVIDPEHGRLIVASHGKRHVITCGADSISQRAVVNDDVSEAESVGTEVRIEWGLNDDPDWGVTWPFDGLYPTGAEWGGHFFRRFREMVEGFAIFNPHATVALNWFGETTTWEATDTEWQKWKPCKPTSPHWYERTHLERLIGAYVTHDRDTDGGRLVSDFIAEFDGLTGSQNRSRVLNETDLRRMKLSEFVVDGHLDSDRIAALLASMQKHTRPVTPKRLGVIGEDHLRERLTGMGVQPESFRYSKKFAKGGLPWVLESAFGWLGEEADDQRRIYAGANWSSAIKNPFRSFGDTGEGLETTLADLRATRHEPIVFVLHLAHPRVEYTDRGKSALVINGGEK